jgi:predicted ArsR family transcriptional regulator
MTRRGETQTVVRRPGETHMAVLREIIETGPDGFTVADVARRVGCHEAYARRVVAREVSAGRVEVAEVAEPNGGRPARVFRKVDGRA